MSSLDDYTVGAIIGRGQFAAVKLGEHVHSGRKVAMKFLDKSRLDQNFKREIANQRVLLHQNVIKIEDIIETDDEIIIVLEFAQGGDLFDYLVRHVRLKEDEAKRIFRQLIAAVGHCHERMVVHRDLKPENILMDDNFDIKLADFGLSSQWAPGELLTDSCGSPNYAAPELLSKGCAYEGPEVDIWSCGVLLYALLCGCLPFDDDTIPGLFKKIKRGSYSLPGHLSQGAKDLIIKMLTIDRADRIGLQAIRQHDWFKDEPAVPLPSLLTTPQVAAAPLADDLAIATVDTASILTCNVSKDQGYPAVTTMAAAVEKKSPEVTSRRKAASKSAQQLLSVGGRMRTASGWMRTASGRLLKQCSGFLSERSSSWPHEALNSVKKSVTL